MTIGAEDVFLAATWPITPVGTGIVLLSMGVLAVVATRSRSGLIVAALVGAYVARRVGLRTGFIKWLDHRVLERLSETFDNVEGWLIAFLVCALVLSTSRTRAKR